MDAIPTAVAVISQTDVVRELTSALAEAGVGASQPVPVASPADPLDAPIGPDEQDRMYEVVTVILDTDADVSTFAAHLNRSLVQNPGASAVLHDARGGRARGRASATTPASDIAAMLQ